MAESLDGNLAKVIWSGPGFDGQPRVIAKLVGGEIVKGDMHRPRVGEHYRFWGEWARARPPRTGLEFEFTSHEVVIEQSVDGVVQYLRTHIDGLGWAKAERVVDHFGAETLTVLRSDPDRALEVRGVTPAVVAAMRDHFDQAATHDPVAEARLIEMFRGQQFPRSIVAKLMRAYRSAAPAVVRHNPYLLLTFPRVGWQQVDAFARAVAGYDPAGLARHRGAVAEAFQLLARRGHTCSPMAEVDQVASSLLQMRCDGRAWASLAADGEVVAYRPDDQGVRHVALARFAAAEQAVADHMARLLRQAAPLPAPPGVDGLAAEQAEAVATVARFGVALVVGAPGTGKSFTVAATVAELVAMGFDPSRVVYVAPTGKAARRGAELLADHRVAGVACTTIHRALCPVPSQDAPGVAAEDARAGRGRRTFKFARGPARPVPADVVVCDEASMVDAPLAADLLSALASGTRLVVVGDDDQLPSVGPGAVLRDLIDAGMPTARLRQIRRSDAAGTVVRACHAIREGRIPTPDAEVDLDAGRNWIHYEVEHPAQVADLIVDLHRTAPRFDSVWGKQVICPQKAREFGTLALNARLAALLNPAAAAAQAEAAAGPDPGGGFLPPFCVGDKVIRTENGLADELFDRPTYRLARQAGDDRTRTPFHADWGWMGTDYAIREAPVVNGDMGVVVGVVAVPGSGQQVLVRLRNPDRLVRLPYADCKIQQAYALTCHKCVHPETLVETAEGLLPIRAIAREGTIASPGGPRPYRNFVENPESPCLTFETDGGYALTTTLDHMVEVVDPDGSCRMVEALEVRPGQMMRLKLGTTIDPSDPVGLPDLPPGDCRSVRHRVPTRLDGDVAEFFGLMVADGTVFNSGFRLVKQHREVVDRFAWLCGHLFGVTPRAIEIGETAGYEVSSTLLSAWFGLVGGMAPRAKDIPECILRSPAWVQQRFLRGLFEDGSAHATRNGKVDHVEWESVYPGLRSKVRVMLLRLGIIAGKVAGKPQRLCIYGTNASRFAATVGFITAAKQRVASLPPGRETRYRIPVSRAEVRDLVAHRGVGSWTRVRHAHARARGYISRDTAACLVAESLLPTPTLDLLRDRLSYHYESVASVTTTAAPTMCVEVPDGHRFLQNGFPHGNCQGSGFPMVIVPVHRSAYWDPVRQVGLFHREWLYTALSRVETLLVTVGQMAAIRAAVARPTKHLRRTRLAAMVRHLLADGIPESPPPPSKAAVAAATGSADWRDDEAFEW